MNLRGIVVTPPFEAREGFFNVISTTIDPVLLRKYVLYWDIIDWPDNNGVKFDPSGITDEIRLLIDEGKMKRTQVNFEGSWPAERVVPTMQAQAFMENNKRDGETWSLAISERKFLITEELGKLDRTIELELYQALPVPSASVPLEEILNFRHKRNDEFLKFRGELDDLYLEIINSGDIQREKSRAIERVEQSIGDINKSIRQSRVSYFVSTLKVELNISDLVRDSIIATAITSSVFELPNEIAIGAGILTAAIKISTPLAPRFKGIPPEVKDYAYISHIHSDLLKSKNHKRGRKKRSS